MIKIIFKIAKSQKYQNLNAINNIHKAHKKIAKICLDFTQKMINHKPHKQFRT